MFKDGHIPLTGNKPDAIEQCGDLIHFLASDASMHRRYGNGDRKQSLITG